MSGIGVVLTAHVKDPAKWEKGFRSHTELHRRGPTQLIHYTVTQNNDIVMYSETENVDEYLKYIRSPEVAKAMDEDGVDRDTLKVYPLEKEFEVH
jgi:hypothetical protein